MIMVEQTPVPAAALPIEAFRDHLRLGTGFPDDGVQDQLLETFLRSALSAVEQRTAKAVLRRSFLWQLTAWRGMRREELPVAPVAAILAVRVIEGDGNVTTVDTSRYRLEPDMHRPHLAASGFGLPSIPVGGAVEVVFEAGYSQTWIGVPNDLKQAVFLLAADFYEHRNGAGGAGLQPRVIELLAAYRAPRLFGRRS